MTTPSERQQSKPQPRADAVAIVTEPVGPTTPVSDRFIGYLLLLAVLIFLLYVLPEMLVFKQNGFAPTEHLAETGTHPSLREILAGLWTDRAEILNPMNNPLVRFFLVTMSVGVVFDRVKKYWPSTREPPDERLP